MFLSRLAVETVYTEFHGSNELVLSDSKQKILSTIVSTIWFLSSLVVAVFVPNIASVVDFLGCLATCFILIFPGNGQLYLFSCNICQYFRDMFDPSSCFVRFRYARLERKTRVDRRLHFCCRRLLCFRHDTHGKHRIQSPRISSEARKTLVSLIRDQQPFSSLQLY